MIDKWLSISLEEFVDHLNSEEHVEFGRVALMEKLIVASVVLQELSLDGTPHHRGHRLGPVTGQIARHLSIQGPDPSLHQFGRGSRQLSFHLLHRQVLNVFYVLQLDSFLQTVFNLVKKHLNRA